MTVLSVGSCFPLSAIKIGCTHSTVVCDDPDEVVVCSQFGSLNIWVGSTSEGDREREREREGEREYVCAPHLQSNT